jgi:hypothetical protein
MNFTIIIPHYKEWKATLYAIHKIFKHSAGHHIDLIIVDNFTKDQSIANLKQWFGKVTFFSYPENELQSQGIAFDFVLRHVRNPYFILLESDGFPDRDGWLEYYIDLIRKGYECAGSKLKLSGGEYIHPCGALYSMEAYLECKEYIENLPYSYYPNMAFRDNFQYHLMVHDAIREQFLDNPDDWIFLTDGYKPFSKELAEKRRRDYLPATGVFHNGMGTTDDHVHTYGGRSMESESAIIGPNTKKLIRRVGLEPGQFFSYWLKATGRKIFEIPTEIKWLPNRENQQQEYTLNEAGVKHCWAGSSYLGMKDTDMNDVYEFKKNQIEELYLSINP